MYFLKNSEQNLLCDLINVKTTSASFQSSNKLFKVYFEMHIVIFSVTGTFHSNAPLQFKRKYRFFLAVFQISYVSLFFETG